MVEWQNKIILISFFEGLSKIHGNPSNFVQFLTHHGCTNVRVVMATYVNLNKLPKSKRPNQNKLKN